jgi:ribosomal protein L29
MKTINHLIQGECLRYITFENIAELVAELNAKLSAQEFMEIIKRCENLQKVREYRKVIGQNGLSV